MELVKPSLLNNAKEIIIFLFITVASLIRLLFMSSHYQDAIASRVEISTPLNSWKRVTEGVYLLNNDVNPYFGDRVHEPPLNLNMYRILINVTSFSGGLELFFILCDVLTSIILYHTAKRYVKIKYKEQKLIFQKFTNKRIAEAKIKDKQAEKKSKYKSNVWQLSSIFLKEEDIEDFPLYCMLLYLFNPFTVFNCVAMTTTVVSNLVLSSLLWTIVYDCHASSLLLVAFSTAQSLYPITYLAPVTLNISTLKDNRYSPFKFFYSTVQFAVLLFALLALSRHLYGSWDYVDSVYTFILNVDDLQPNIGLFWYFFTEMFEHFQDLFIAAFQINILVLYVVPLSIRFRKDPLFLAVSLLMLNTIFKAYPSLGDVGLCLSVLAIWANLVINLHQIFVVMIVLLAAFVLGPIVWYLWIVAGTANANFYFGVTLCIASAQIFLLTDLLFAYVKREFWLKTGGEGINQQDNVKLILD